jgi:hypothetical protein
MSNTYFQLIISNFNIMAYKLIPCTSTSANTGQTSCSEDYGADRFIIISSQPFSFATQTDAETKQNWIDLITGAASPQVYPFPLAVLVEDQNTDAIIEEVSRLERNFINNGEYGTRLRLNSDVALGLHQNLVSFNGLKPYIVIVTDKGFIKAKSSDNVLFEAIKTTQFYTEKQQGATLETQAATFVTYAYAADDWDSLAVYIQPIELASGSWDALDGLDGIVGVTGTEVTATTATIVIDLSTEFNGVPVVGDSANFALGDFLLDATTSAATASMVNNGDGTYTFTPTTTYAVGAGTIQLDTPANTGQRFSQATAITLNIV